MRKIIQGHPLLESTRSIPLKTSQSRVCPCPGPRREIDMAATIKTSHAVRKSRGCHMAFMNLPSLEPGPRRKRPAATGFSYGQTMITAQQLLIDATGYIGRLLVAIPGSQSILPPRKQNNSKQTIRQGGNPIRSARRQAASIHFARMP